MSSTQESYAVLAFVLLSACISVSSGLAGESAAQDSARTSVEAEDAAATGDAALPGAAWGALSPAAASAAVAEKKDRVEKPHTRRRDDGGTYADEDDDDDCVGSCLGDMFISFFSSSSGPGPSSTAPMSATAASDTAYVEPAAPPPPPPAPFALVLGIAGWSCGPSEVQDEYDKGGWRASLGVGFVSAESFAVDVDAAYGVARGDPLYDYRTSTQYDSPQVSHLRIFDVGVRAGMIHRLSSRGLFLRWGLGPRVYWVKEDATVEVYELPSMRYLGEKQESLEAWRLGGDVSVALEWDLRMGLSLGLAFRYFLVPWSGDATHSLTLDHIGSRSLNGFSAAFTIGFNGL